jgi:hypothetical protein
VPSSTLFTRDIERWQQIYDLFDLPLPHWQISCTQTDELMLPFFNAGVILVQNGLGFAEIWEDCCRRIDAEVSITNKYPWLDQLALPVAIARLNLTVNVLDDRFNYPVHVAALPKELPFFCHYHESSWIRGEPRLNQLVSELANTYPTVKKRLLSSPRWAYFLEPYTLTEKFLYLIKRQIKTFKYHTKRYFHINSTLDQKDVNVLGHSSGIETR